MRFRKRLVRWGNAAVVMLAVWLLASQARPTLPNFGVLLGAIAETLRPALQPTVPSAGDPTP